MFTSLNVLHNSFPPYLRKMLINVKCISLRKHSFCRDMFYCYDMSNLAIKKLNYLFLSKTTSQWITITFWTLNACFKFRLSYQYVVDLGFLCTITLKIQYEYLDQLIFFCNQNIYVIVFSINFIYVIAKLQHWITCFWSTHYLLEIMFCVYVISLSVSTLLKLFSLSIINGLIVQIRFAKILLMFKMVSLMNIEISVNIKKMQFLCIQ